MPKGEKTKTCFVIAPIGDEGSETRRRSDQMLTHIIKPAVKECGYEAVRADEISEPGIITSQVIQHIIDDELVIADLTGKNPNVFYELAVRHTVKKPVVQLIESSESIPFDVAPTRTIHVDHRDLDSVASCKDELIRQIRSVEKDASKVDSPISVAIDLKLLRQSENPLEKSNAEIISMLQDLRSMIVDAAVSSQRVRLDRSMVEDLFMSYGRAFSLLDLLKGEDPSREQFEQARYHLSTSISVLERLAIESGLSREIVSELMHRMRLLHRGGK